MNVFVLEFFLLISDSIGLPCNITTLFSHIFLLNIISELWGLPHLREESINRMAIEVAHIPLSQSRV